MPVAGVCVRVRARKVDMDGYTFDSVHESEVYSGLKWRLRDGEIRDLAIHPKFVFTVNGAIVGTMKPDFTFFDIKGFHVLDAKGFKKSKKTGKMLPRVDREFGIKRKLMKALYGYDIEIV